MSVASTPGCPALNPHCGVYTLPALYTNSLNWLPFKCRIVLRQRTQTHFGGAWTRGKWWCHWQSWETVEEIALNWVGHGRDASYSSPGNLHHLNKTIKLGGKVAVLIDWWEWSKVGIEAPGAGSDRKTGKKPWKQQHDRYSWQWRAVDNETLSWKCQEIIFCKRDCVLYLNLQINGAVVYHLILKTNFVISHPCKAPVHS